MTFEEVHGIRINPIRQQGDSEEIFLPGELDGVFEQLRAVTLATMEVMDDDVLKENDKPALSGADCKEQIDHPDDGVVRAQNEDPPAIRLLHNQAQTAHLCFGIHAKIGFVRKEVDEQLRELRNILQYSWFDTRERELINHSRGHIA